MTAIRWGASVLLVVACGETVNDDAAGGTGGEGGTGASGASSASQSSSAAGGDGVGGGPFVCKSHDDCEQGSVCLFAQGVCAVGCDATSWCESCGGGTVCNACATGSCPACADCVAACVPSAAGDCDDDDPCPPDQVCIWQQHRCAPLCNAAAGCDDPSLFCADCVTGSCCGCENCVSACIAGDL